MRVTTRWAELEANPQGLADLTFERGLQVLAAPLPLTVDGGEMEVAVASIRVGERCRKEMGDLKGLAASIAHLGLLQPIIVTPDRLLVCGQRRLKAVKLLGWETIPATVRDDIDPAVAEQAENQWLDYSPSERWAIRRAIKELEGRQAGKRKRRGAK
jgi:ParB family chromosome partitioning protein